MSEGNDQTPPDKEQREGDVDSEMAQTGGTVIGSEMGDGSSRDRDYRAEPHQRVTARPLSYISKIGPSEQELETFTFDDEKEEVADNKEQEEQTESVIASTYADLLAQAESSGFPQHFLAGNDAKKLSDSIDASSDRAGNPFLLALENLDRLAALHNRDGSNDSSVRNAPSSSSLLTPVGKQVASSLIAISRQIARLQGRLESPSSKAVPQLLSLFPEVPSDTAIPVPSTGIDPHEKGTETSTTINDRHDVRHFMNRRKNYASPRVGTSPLREEGSSSRPTISVEDGDAETMRLSEGNRTDLTPGQSSMRARMRELADEGSRRQPIQIESDDSEEKISPASKRRRTDSADLTGRD